MNRFDLVGQIREEMQMFWHEPLVSVQGCARRRWPGAAGHCGTKAFCQVLGDPISALAE